MNPVTQTFLAAWPLLLLFLTAAWLVSVRLRNAAIVDPLWGLTFIIAAWFYRFNTPDGDPTRKLIVVALVTIWGLRLSLYLFWRNHGKPEDYRYQEFRQKYGPERYWWVSLFQVFWLQATLAWLISSTLLGAQAGSRPFGWLDWLGVAIWVIGFLFEAGGDWQLTRFRANPANRGKVLESGFWRYTRHPNYFGDAACWWGYGVLALAAGSWLAPLGALLMTWLLLRISGVTLLEASLEKSKPHYRAYQERTSAFLPWPPKRDR
jgi:steroid 5-alpha reductase family enzyme